RLDAIADILNAVRRVARDDAPLRPVVEAECRNALVPAVEDPRLRVRRGRRQPAEPAPQVKAVAVQQTGQGGAIAELHRASQVLVRERVNLQRDESAPVVTWPALTTKGEILDRIVSAEQRPHACMGPAILTV